MSIPKTLKVLVFYEKFKIKFFHEQNYLQM